MFNFLNSINLSGICTDSNLKFILQIVKAAVRIICIAAPFALIIFGSLDFFKAIIAGDEKEMKAKRKPFIGRLVAAIIVILMPTIIDVIIKTLAGNNNSFANCWKATSSTEIDVPSIDY